MIRPKLSFLKGRAAASAATGRSRGPHWRSGPVARSAATTAAAPAASAARPAAPVPAPRSSTRAPRRSRRDLAGQGGGQRRVNRLGSGSPRSGPRRRRQPGRCRSAQQCRGGDRPGFPPGKLLVVSAQRLLPAELHKRAEQAERQLASPTRAWCRRQLPASACRYSAIESSLDSGRRRQLIGQVPGQVAERRRRDRAAPSPAERCGRDRRSRGCRASSCCARASAACSAAPPPAAPDRALAGWRRPRRRARPRPASASPWRPAAAPGDPTRWPLRPRPSTATAPGTCASSARRRPQARSSRRPRAAPPCAAGTGGAGRQEPGHR